MSDPVTNVEIEDVLSSIRRLVSVDSGRPKRERAAGDGKLVLTQDYRISPPPTHDEAESVPAEQTANLAEDYTKTLERRISELEAAVTAQAAEFEPDGSEDTTQHRPTRVLFPARDVPDPAPDGVVDLDVLLSDLEFDVGLADPSVETATVDPAPMWEAAVDSVAETPQQDDGIEILDAETHRNNQQAEDEAQFAFSSEDAVIDEEALRDMVAEIVRQELQGDLGERITRNVRKLVRREIMRAISIRDFE